MTEPKYPTSEDMAAQRALMAERGNIPIAEDLQDDYNDFASNAGGVVDVGRRKYARGLIERTSRAEARNELLLKTIDDQGGDVIRLVSEVAQLKAERDAYVLDDSILRKAYEDSGVSGRFTWHGWLCQLVRDNATLRTDNLRLKAPFTTADVSALYAILTALYEGVQKPSRSDVAIAMDALLTARTQGGSNGKSGEAVRF